MNHPRANSESQTGSRRTIPPVLTSSAKLKIPDQCTNTESACKAEISSFETAPMPALTRGENQRQNSFIHAVVDDIACQATMRLPVLQLDDIACQTTMQLPVLRLTSEKQEHADQSEIITRTAGSAAIAGLGNLIFAVLKYATNVVMTNIVSEAIYGSYIAAYTSATILGSIAVLGLDSTMLRFLSMYRAKDEHHLAAGLVRFVIWMTLISGLLFGMFFFLSATALARLVYHQDAYTLPFKESALLIPMVALQLVFSSGLQGLKVIKWKVFVDRLIQPSVCLVLIAIFYLYGLRLDALILATISGFLASVITGQVLFRKASKQMMRDTAPAFEPKTWLRFALPMSFNSLIQSVMNSADVLFLTAFSTAAQVGLYAAADRASAIIIMPLLALNTIFSPLIAEYYAQNEHGQIANLFKIATKWSFTLSLPLFLCFFVFNEPILSIFSKGYTEASMALIILSLGNLINAGTGLTGTLLLMTGHTRVILANITVSIAFNAGLAYLLVPHFNVVGAAIAAASAVVALDLVSLIEVICILKIWAFRWDMLKPLAAGATASIVGLLLLRFIHVGYGYRAIFGTLGLILPFMLVYISVLALLRFSTEDQLVFDTVRAKLGKNKSARA